MPLPMFGLSNNREMGNDSWVHSWQPLNKRASPFPKRNPFGSLGQQDHERGFHLPIPNPLDFPNPISKQWKRVTSSDSESYARFSIHKNNPANISGHDLGSNARLSIYT